ncbi:MAG: hypothetical protein NWE93_12420 [Candidatus Bathyarchaeota archaeon]|nr:hypothetical protein [Candidatus Bathyarchaeota archaeon]
MPTIVPNYVYSLFAALVVGAIVVYACATAVGAMQSRAQTQQLTNIEQYVAAEALTLLSHTNQNNQTSSCYLDLPCSVGNKPYWISLETDASGAWVHSGFGSYVQSVSYGVYVPAEAEASGSFVGGSGRPMLQCRFENQVATLTLTVND